MSELDKALEKLHNEGYSSENIKAVLNKLKPDTLDQRVPSVGALIMMRAYSMKDINPHEEVISDVQGEELL